MSCQTISTPFALPLHTLEEQNYQAAFYEQLVFERTPDDLADQLGSLDTFTFTFSLENHEPVQLSWEALEFAAALMSPQDFPNYDFAAATGVQAPQKIPKQMPAAAVPVSSVPRCVSSPALVPATAPLPVFKRKFDDLDRFDRALYGEVKALKTSHDHLNAELSSMKHDLDDIKDDFKDLKHDFKILKRDVKDINPDASKVAAKGRLEADKHFASKVGKLSVEIDERITKLEVKLN